MLTNITPWDCVIGALHYSYDVTKSVARNTTFFCGTVTWVCHAICFDVKVRCPWKSHQKTARLKRFYDSLHIRFFLTCFLLLGREEPKYDIVPQTTSETPAHARSSHGLRGRRTNNAKSSGQQRDSDSQGSSGSLQGVSIGNGKSEYQSVHWESSSATTFLSES